MCVASDAGYIPIYSGHEHPGGKWIGGKWSMKELFMLGEAGHDVKPH